MENKIASSNFQNNAVPNGPTFLEGAKTIYHEARHCEQWFCMARFKAVGHQVTEQTLANELGIPLNVASEALKQKMGGDDVMLKPTQKWYESIYGRSGRAIDLTALKLRPTGNQASMQSMHQRFHDRYAEGLPEEKDAWDCGKLLDLKYAWP